MKIRYCARALDVELPGKGRGFTSPAFLRPSDLRALKIAALCDGTVSSSNLIMQRVVDAGLATWTDLRHTRVEINDAGRFRVALEIL